MFTCSPYCLILPDVDSILPDVDSALGYGDVDSAAWWVNLACGDGRSEMDVGRTKGDRFSLSLCEFQLCWVSAKEAAIGMWETEAQRAEGISLRSTVRVSVGMLTWLPLVSSETDSCEQSGTGTCGEQQPVY